jgi:hypothetical protein
VMKCVTDNNTPPQIAMLQLPMRNSLAPRDYRLSDTNRVNKTSHFIVNNETNRRNYDH